MIDINKLPLQEQGGLIDLLKTVVDPRKPRGVRHPVVTVVAVDGKTLRGAHDAGKRPVHLLSAILHQEAVVIGQIAVEEKTNEISKLPELLAPWPLQGAVVTADALHTQHQTARYIVEKKEADYLLVAKDNQPTLRNLAISLLRMLGVRYIAPALRAYARLGQGVLRLIGVPD